MSSEDQLPILRIRPSDVAERALVVGDPHRAEMAAGLLEDARQVGANREYVTYTGRSGGTLVTVCSHGVGGAGAAICFEELARAGVKTVIRAGTCGALREELRDGELVIATGAVRDEGLTPRLVPLSYPALAHLDIITALMTAAEQSGSHAHHGVVLTSDLFYPSAVLGPIDWNLWRSSGVVAVEMEASALFIVAALHGMRAGAILTIDGNPTDSAKDMSEYNPHRTIVSDGVTQMLAIALHALQSTV